MSTLSEITESSRLDVQKIIAYSQVKPSEEVINIVKQITNSDTLNLSI